MKRQDAAGTPRLAFSGAESSAKRRKLASEINWQTGKAAQVTKRVVLRETFLKGRASKAMAGTVIPADFSAPAPPEASDR